MLETNQIQFQGFSSPVISFTKWIDSKNDKVFYDLYINLQYDCRYDSFEDMIKRIELISKGLGGFRI